MSEINAHTDTGSLIVLLTSDWGFQAYSPRGDTWEYVAPREDCAIIKVGDALKFMSSFELKSSLYRILPWRHCAESGFFLRPNNNAKLLDGEGVEWTAGEWLEASSRATGFLTVSRRSTIWTDRKGFTGLVEAASESTLIA